jgi:hypothetical protein
MTYDALFKHPRSVARSLALTRRLPLRSKLSICFNQLCSFSPGNLTTNARVHIKENDEEGHDDNPANDDDDNGANDAGMLANEESQQEDGENILAEILRTTFVFVCLLTFAMFLPSCISTDDRGSVLAAAVAHPIAAATQESFPPPVSTISTGRSSSSLVDEN